jgi:inner membrane protein
MPSAFAHAAVGASLATLLPRRFRSPWAPVVLGALAAAPDLDVLALQVGVPYAHPLGHRGFSHSLCFAALVGLVSLPLWRRTAPGGARLAALLTGLAVASHGLLDTLTDRGGGVGLLIPFVDRRYSAPWHPILTSPLSVRAFFSERGLAVLSNEAVWIGLPCLALLLLVRGLRSRPGSSPAPGRRAAVRE